LRGLFETSLSLGFILADATFHEDRATCYRAFRLIQKLKIHTRYDPGTPEGEEFHRILDADPRIGGTPFPRKDLSQHRRQITETLNTAEYRPFWDKYKNAKRKPRHWYTLYCEANDLRSLAKLIDREAEYLVLYKAYSEVAHASDVLSGVLLSYPGRGVRVHRLRGPLERLKETTNLAANYLVDCHLRIQKAYFPDIHPMAQWFAQWYFGPYHPFFAWATSTDPLIVPEDSSAETDPVSQVSHEQVAKRAYEIYQKRISLGALDDWLTAEQELRG
jgi:hypothetical protein